MKKKKTYCLRQFEYLDQKLQARYLYLHGTFLTKNESLFTSIPYNGDVMKAKSILLFKLFTNKGKSNEAKKAYVKQVSLLIDMITENYLAIDVLALTNPDIIGLAGLKSTNKYVAKTSKPSVAENTRYVYTNETGQIDVKYNFDKLAHSALLFTTSNPDVIIEKINDFQIRISLGDTFVDMNITSKVKTRIKKQKKGTAIKTVSVLFNPNGLSPISDPIEVTVPK
jgi:hypothetical protein